MRDTVIIDEAHSISPEAWAVMTGPTPAPSQCVNVLQGSYSPPAPWYVVRVRTGTDQRVTATLRQRGFDVFSPIGTKVSKHRRSKKRIETDYPVFAGYIFVRVQPGAWDTLMVLQDVLGPLRTGGKDTLPTKISPLLIRELQEAQDHGKLRLTGTYVAFTRGEVVTVDFFGKWVEAVVRGVKGENVESVADFDGKKVVIDRPHFEYRAVT